MNRWVTVNDWAVIFGAMIAVAGLLLAMLVKPRYAVRIKTAEGENDVVVSRQREYIRQIIEGLNKALRCERYSGLNIDVVYVCLISRDAFNMKAVGLRNVFDQIE
ncbi:MAG: DUF6232 family protein [Bacteroidota bacterium]